MHLKHQHVPSLWIPFILIIIIILKTFNIKLSLYRQEKILKQGKGDAVYTINTQSAAAFAFLPKTTVTYLKQSWIHRSLVTSSRAEVPRGEKSQRGWAGSASSSARTADQLALWTAYGKQGNISVFTVFWPCSNTAIATDHTLLWNFMPKCKIAKQFTNISACHFPSLGLVYKLSVQMVCSKSTAMACAAGSRQWFLTVDNLRELCTTSLNHCRL